MMREDRYCSDSNCACHIDAYPTDEKCPTCGRRLRLMGKAHLMELRLTCQSCGYQSPLLSPEELREFL